MDVMIISAIIKAKRMLPVLMSDNLGRTSERKPSMYITILSVCLLLLMISMVSNYMVARQPERVCVPARIRTRKARRY